LRQLPQMLLWNALLPCGLVPFPTIRTLDAQEAGDDNKLLDLLLPVMLTKAFMEITGSSNSCTWITLWPSSTISACLYLLGTNIDFLKIICASIV